MNQEKYAGEEDGGWISVLQTDPSKGPVVYLADGVCTWIDTEQYRQFATKSEYKRELRHHLLPRMTSSLEQADLFTDGYYIDKLLQIFPELQVGKVHLRLATPSNIID